MKNMKTRRLALFICNVSIIAMVLVPLSFLINVPEALADSVTVNCSGTSGSPTAVTEGDLAGDDVTFSDSGGDGYCELDASISAASVLIETGVVLTHAAQGYDRGDGVYEGVKITTTGNFEIESGASINVSQKGCQGVGTSDGRGPDSNNVCTLTTSGYGDRGINSGQGAGHGGAGGLDSAGNNAGGAIYDSNIAPSMFGSSGGGTDYGGTGGNGGGLIQLTVGGNFTHNGILTADASAGSAGNGRGAGGGSGGTINVAITGDFTGSTGTFSADGGAGGDQLNNDGGGGAGGRIALAYATSSFSGLDSSEFSADGGIGPGAAEDGGNGSVYVKNTTTNAVTIYEGFTLDADYSATTWTIDSSAGLYCDGTDATPSITATGALTLAGTLDCDHASITGFDTSAGTSVSISGFTVTMAPAIFWTMDDGVSVVIESSSAIMANVQWTDLDSFSIDATSSINTNSLGCQGVADSAGYGPDESNVCTVSTAGYGARSASVSGEGAGYGGAGGAGSDGTSFAGDTYGSETAPVLVGSSGGGAPYGTTGGDGGGLIRISAAGTISVSGTLTADGTDGLITGGHRAGGGGSGGAIYLTASTFSGTDGTISADGGDGGDETNDGGGGGGGRVSIEYGADSSNYLSGLTASSVCAGGAATGSAVAGSDGTLSTAQTVYLDSFTITDNSGYTKDSTPVITLVESGATPTHVAFSCNDSDWSSWLEYPDDDVVNDGDGPAFDMTSDATGCSSTEELKTIYAKIKDGSSESSSVDDTTTYDITSPTVSYVTASNADDTYGAGVELAIQAVFDEVVTDTGLSVIYLDFDGDNRSATYDSGTGTDTLVFTYTTVNGDNKTDLDYTSTSALSDGGGTITDIAGNFATLTLPTVGGADSLAGRKDINVSTNQEPTVASVTASQATDGSGEVTITFEMDDPDDDDTLEALVEYDIGGGWTKAKLSETDENASATYGDPKVENDDTYQVGNASGYITSSSGANTVSVIWESAADEAAADLSTAQVRITPYDSITTGTAATKTNITLDNVDPVSLASFAKSSATTTTATFTWTAATDSNFSSSAHYEIWIDTDQSNVTGRSGATEWDNSDDTDLATVTTATTTITGLSKQTTYYAKIWAIDDYGNETTLSDISFTTASAGQTATSSPTPEVASPEGGADSVIGSTNESGTCEDGLNPGQDLAISWTSSSSVGLVNIYYSTDGGSTYTLIAGPIMNTDYYTWTIPADIVGSTLQFKIEGTDLAIITTSFQTQTCALNGAEDTTSEDTDTDTEDTTQEVTEPTTGEQGYSPVTGELEDISVVSAGDYIRSSYFSTVYFIDTDDSGNTVRRPFMDAQTFFTYQDSFENIKTVTDATLTTITLGNPMLPNPGVVLIKIQSDPKVYAIDEDGQTIRWIQTEEIANTLYGQDWADYIIDIEATFFPRFTRGEDVQESSDLELTDTQMKQRSELSE